MMLPYWSVAVMVRLSAAPAVGVVLVALRTSLFCAAAFTVVSVVGGQALFAALLLESAGDDTYHQ